jgi:hypothetical protein
MDLIKDFVGTNRYKEDTFVVHATLSDCSLGWYAFRRKTFGFYPNTCANHTMGIPAANYSRAEYYTSREVYDEMYDYMVRISKIEVEQIAEKAHEAVQRFLIEKCDDTP